MQWIKARIKERTTLDGIALITIGAIVILAGPFAKVAAYCAIGYGGFTLIKGEK